MAYLIRGCEIQGRPLPCDVRLAGDTILAVADSLAAQPGERIIEAAGARLLPGLHDHHIHLASLAASLDSLHCGPPAVHTAADLAERLRVAAAAGDDHWLRGIGYHDCVAGDIDRHWLDRVIPWRPVRLQHRGGRLWVLNSAALSALGVADSAGPGSPAGLETRHGRPTGRLYDCDQWLREKLRSSFPSLAPASRLLASCGVTGITDTSPGNDPETAAHFRRARQSGDLLQVTRMMGSLALTGAASCGDVQCGEYKVHLLESQLPDIDDLCKNMQAAHDQGRNIAVHCVSLAELVFAIACLEQVGPRAGDRIEHAAITPPAMLDRLAALELRVVTQPHFIAERGDQYAQDVASRDLPWLYRLRGFLEAGIPLAGGSDAPFGSADPWQAMAAAVQRRTAQGGQLGAREALTPEQALALFTSVPEAPGVRPNRIEPGAGANLCLLDKPWAQARRSLHRERVAMTWCRGGLVFERAG